VLAAEIALQRNEYLKAAREYRMAAESSNSVEIARQATLISYSFGFNEESLRAANRWLDLEKGSDEALLYVAQLQLRLGKLRDARRSFKKLIDRSEEPPDERLLSLVQVLSQEDAENADAVMRKLAKPYKDSALAHYAAAVMALQADDTAHAEKRSLRAIELEPEWVKAKLLYARTLLVGGKQDEAIDYTARIVGDDPDPDPDARMELAVMMMTAGRDDDALSQINQILLEQPSRFDALRLMAIINFRQENLDAAWDDFQDLLASGYHTTDALYYLARIADFRSELDRSIRLYSQVRSGAHAITSQRRASALIATQKDDPDKALERLDEFASDNPSFAVDMVLAKAQLLAALERYDDALIYYNKYVEFRPDNEGASLGRAELLLRMNRLPDAILEYRRAVKRWPDSAMSLNAFGYTLADRTDEYREAEKLIRKALKLEPESAAIIDSMGWVLFKLGRYDEALIELDRAYAKLDDHEVAAHIVDALDALGRKNEALELLQSAESRHPDSDLLKDVRERVFPDSP
jgi:tetratricopeptide (TPR) repeat protein